tara:strand:- start:353 stop:1255 length:903 start_codon:yes stop_codon:yes gene_type:complete
VSNQRLNLEQWMNNIRSRTDVALIQKINETDVGSKRLRDAMLYAVTSGGKKIRPMLVHAVSDLGDPHEFVVDTVSACIELVHIYSLIHDDLPCMDNDDLRHGKATLHVKYDEATAVLVGDALHCLAFDGLSRACLKVSDSQKLSLINILTRASGSEGMVAGQVLDLGLVGRKSTASKLEKMQKLKTGALISAAANMGAVCALSLKPGEKKSISNFAQIIGRVFQVVDDILDSEANTRTLGKTAGKDLRDKKPNFVSALGLQPAKDYAKNLKKEAIKHLDVFSTRANRLIQLANFIVDRKF